MFNLDKTKVDERDIILFDEPYDQKKYCGGCRRFEGLSASDLKKLADIGVIDLEDGCNYSPTAGEILEFMQAYPMAFTAHGYAISPSRDDYRVTIEGVAQQPGSFTSKKMVEDFTMTFRFADDFDLNPMYCWYD